jgi:hypothetical protein
MTPTTPIGAAVPGGHRHSRVASLKARHAHRITGPASSRRLHPESQVCRSSFLARFQALSCTDTVIALLKWLCSKWDRSPRAYLTI